MTTVPWGATVKVRDEQNRGYAKGLDALVEIVEGRIDLDAVFASRRVARDLAAMSGGSVRDLMRLLQYAQRKALIDEKDRIDRPSAREAMLSMRLDFQRLLIPGQVYYPLLAQIHRTKLDWFAPIDEVDGEKVRQFRKFFSELLFNGSVLEYDGGQNWYDVHPVIQEIDAFKKALADAQAQADAPTEG